MALFPFSLLVDIFLVKPKLKTIVLNQDSKILRFKNAEIKLWFTCFITDGRSMTTELQTRALSLLCAF